MFVCCLIDLLGLFCFSCIWLSVVFPLMGKKTSSKVAKKPASNVKTRSGPSGSSGWSSSNTKRLEERQAKLEQLVKKSVEAALLTAATAGNPVLPVPATPLGTKLQTPTPGVDSSPRVAPTLVDSPRSVRRDV